MLIELSEELFAAVGVVVNVTKRVDTLPPVMALAFGFFFIWFATFSSQLFFHHFAPTTNCSLQLHLTLTYFVYVCMSVCIMSECMNLSLSSHHTLPTSTEVASCATSGLGTLAFGALHPYPGHHTYYGRRCAFTDNLIRCLSDLKRRRELCLMPEKV